MYAPTLMTRAWSKLKEYSMTFRVAFTYKVPIGFGGWWGNKPYSTSFICYLGAKGGSRTHKIKYNQRILSPSCLPIPPL